MSKSPRSRPATIREVADHAGVSMMTVSRHLRKLPGVAEKTAARIDRAVADLDYRPNPSVRALMSAIRRHNPGAPASNLAYLTFGGTENAWRRHHPSRAIFKGAEEEAAKQGYTLVPVWTGTPGLSGARFAQILEARGIHGFLISPLAPDGDFPFGDFTWEKFASVSLGYSLKAPALNITATHQWQLMERLLLHLSGPDSPRVGLILSRGLDERVRGQWISAYLYHRQTRPNLSAPLLVDTAVDPTRIRQKILTWIREQRIGTVLTDAEVLPRMPEGAVESGSPLRVLRLDDAEIVLPDGTRIGRDFHQLGAVAIRLVISLILLDQRGIPDRPVHQLLDPLVIPGN